MNLTDELRKLAELHQQGHLTDEEFTAAKQRLIAESHAEQPTAAQTGTGSTAAPIAEKHFRSSRWSAGNMFFPDAVTLASDGILFRKGALFGSSEERIAYRALASVRVKHGLFLSDISLETSGGSQPIFLNGLWKSDAREIQGTIRAHQQAG
jgi:Short C-terminal domain